MEWDLNQDEEEAAVGNDFEDVEVVETHGGSTAAAGAGKKAAKEEQEDMFVLERVQWRCVTRFFLSFAASDGSSPQRVSAQSAEEDDGGQSAGDHGDAGRARHSGGA